jgi:prepilin-type processing-associated H-X9-DG protein/prepilin-type N-terminal cleavage/methylation domain-containing protein
MVTCSKHRLRRGPCPLGAGRRALTLVELLVVIGILSILIAILVPSLKGAREAGKRSLCATRVAEFAKVTHLYVTEWERYPPSLANTSLPWIGWSGIDWLGAGHNGALVHAAPESGVYFPYVGRIDLYLCPKEEAQIVSADSLITVRQFSYSMNGRTGLMIPDRRNTVGSAATISDADLPLFFEEDPAQNLDAQPEGCFTGDDRPFMRHRGKTNVGFADAHVRTQQFTEDTTAKKHFDAIGVPMADILLHR